MLNKILLRIIRFITRSEIKEHSKTKRQHYVPRMYLKGFSNSSNRLYVYNKEDSHKFMSNISRIGQENYFYDIDEEQTVEKVFSHLESQFASALRKLIENEDLEKLDRGDKKLIADFVAVQFLRTKEKRLVQEEMVNGTLDFITKNLVPDYNLRLTEQGLKEFHISTILDYEVHSNIFLNKMVWTLGINNTSKPLWTSDNPCASYNDLEPEPHSGNLGFKCKGFQLHIPISSRLLLILLNPDLTVSDLSKSKSIKDKSFKKSVSELKGNADFNIGELFPKKMDLNGEHIDIENSLQITSSTQFIFSQDDDFSLADRYLDDCPLYRNKNRKRIRTNF